MTPKRVFEAFTQTDLLKQWWSPSAETDSRLNGAYYVWWQRLGKHLRGKYREFDPGRRLAFTWKWDQEPETPERIVEVDFAGADAGTWLRLIQGYYGEGEAEAEERRGHLEEWLYFLPLIDKLTAT